MEIQTKIPIKFRNIKVDESFWSFIRKNKSFIGYDIEKYETSYWKRIAYKENIFNTRVKSIYHFLNDKFFFGEFFFSDAREIDISAIVKILCEKYEIIPVITDEKFKIFGNDAFIFFEYTGINLSIKYVFTSNESINHLLKNFISNPNSDIHSLSNESLTDML